MPNPFVHVELHTQDPEKAKKFYKELFDWQPQPCQTYLVTLYGRIISLSS